MNFSPEYYLLPATKPALAFSDPAGSNSCIALFEISRSLNLTAPLLFSNKSYFDEKYNSIVQNGIPRFLDEQIDLLFTGTSHPESSGNFEVNCIRAARQNNVHTISFIDHWINFRLRFEGLLPSELPDEIWVVDEAAKELAIEDGLPENKIQVTGNPFHYYLSSFWQPAFRDKTYLDTVGIAREYVHVLFVPDPLLLRGRHRETGFDEGGALKSLLAILRGKENVFLSFKSPSVSARR